MPVAPSREDACVDGANVETARDSAKKDDFSPEVDS
jgi:hypothetical protein